MKDDFQITFCETNLRWLEGEPPSEERTRKQQAMVSEIERLRPGPTRKIICTHFQIQS